MKYKTLAVLLIGLIGGTLLAMSGLVKAKDPESSSSIEAQATLGTALSYQGRLNDGGSPANGAYDFEFKLYDSLTGGTQIGSTLTQSDVQVDNGVFTVFLDFGDVFNGEHRYVEVGVRPGSSTGEYTTLTPRQMLTAVPYALHAKHSSNGVSEFWRVGHVNWQLGQAGIIKFDDRSPGECYPSAGEGLGSEVTFTTVHTATQYLPNGPLPEQLFNFPAPATEKTVRSAKFYIVDRKGTYPEPLNLTLRIYDYDGNPKHTVSASGIDLRTASTGQWITLNLSTNSEDLVISPGEILAFHFPSDGTTLSPLAVLLLFEVEVQ